MTSRYSRRDVLRLSTGVAVTGSLAGCGALGGRDPPATVEAFYTALDEGRTGTARADYVGGPAAEHFPPYFGDGFDDYAISIEETETVDDDGPGATVATTATVEFPPFGEKTVSGEVAVRNQDGSRVWEIPASLPMGTEVEFELPVDRQTPWKLTWYNEDTDELGISRRAGDQDHPLDGSQLVVTIRDAAASWANGRYRWTACGGPASIVTGELWLNRDALEAAGATADSRLDLDGAAVVLSYVVPETYRPFQIVEWESIREHEFEPP